MAGGGLTLPLILSPLNPDPKPLARHLFPRLRLVLGTTQNKYTCWKSANGKGEDSLSLYYFPY